ncbi:hypothetical protein Tco_0448355 [Tanacetum coccineum]
MKDGVWEENPDVVKKEFVNHFRARFEQPSHERPIINMEFPNQLNSFQVADLEAEGSIKEILLRLFFSSWSMERSSYLFHRAVVESGLVSSKVDGLLRGGYVVMTRANAWDDIVDKLVVRLSKWKMKTLSIGGRLTLLKSVLGAMSIYHMSIFKVPMKVLHRMESIRSRFLIKMGCGGFKLRISIVDEGYNKGPSMGIRADLSCPREELVEQFQMVELTPLVNDVVLGLWMIDGAGTLDGSGFFRLLRFEELWMTIRRLDSFLVFGLKTRWI